MHATGNGNGAAGRNGAGSPDSLGELFEEPKCGRIDIGKIVMSPHKPQNGPCFVYVLVLLAGKNGAGGCHKLDNEKSMYYSVRASQYWRTKRGEEELLAMLAQQPKEVVFPLFNYVEYAKMAAEGRNGQTKPGVGAKKYQPTN